MSSQGWLLIDLLTYQSINQVPRYPVDRNEHLHMTRPGPNELAHRRTVETHIPAWLPALHPHMDVVIRSLINQ